MKSINRSGLATGILLTGLASSIYAVELDVYGAFGMAEEPMETYYYSDGTESNLMAGEGQGVYVGQQVSLFGPLSLQVRAGIQHGFITAEDGYYRDTFTYFPAYGNLVIDLPGEWSVLGGAFYAINPFYKITEGEENGTVKFDSDVGFNIAARWTSTPTSANSDTRLYMEVRYESTQATYASYSDTLGNSVDLSSANEKTTISNLGLAIGMSF